MWTLALVSTGLLGMWLVGKHWQGWWLYLLNEVLWFAYAVHTHDHALMFMAWVWAAAGARNLVLHRRKALTEAHAGRIVQG